MVLMAKSKNTKHIVISEDNYNELKKLGHAGDSMDDVISRLLGKEP